MARASARAMVWCGLVVVSVSTVHGQDPSAPPGGQQLPAPFGVGLTLYSQQQDYRLQRLELGIDGIDPALTEGLPVVNRTDSFHLKLDRWVLPFLNLYAIGGRLETTTTVSLNGIEIGLPFPLNDLRIANDGWMWGGGFTLAVGGRGWFASVSTTYTSADLEVTNGTVEALVVTPKLGMTVDRGAVWIGAMYQDAEERHRGTYKIPFVGEVPFDVVLGEASEWSGLLGATAGLGEHFVLVLEGGFGPRRSALIGLEYRP